VRTFFRNTREKSFASTSHLFAYLMHRAVDRGNRRGARDYTAHLDWYQQYGASPCVGSYLFRRDDAAAYRLLSLYHAVQTVNASYHCCRADAYLSVTHPHHEGRIETHFHVLWLASLLAFYRDWRVFIPATVVVG